MSEVRTASHSGGPPESILWVTTIFIVICIVAAAFFYQALPRPLHFQDTCPLDIGAGMNVHKPFLGKWNGKWDDTWAVELDVSDQPQNNGFLVVYRWEEHVGQPKLEQTFLACLHNGTLVDDGEVLSLRLNAPAQDSAHLMGAFREHTRQAEMTRSFL